MASFFDFVMTFQRTLKASQLYALAHPRHAESLAILEETYRQFLQDRGQIQIAARNGRIFVDGQLEDVDNLQVRTLAKDLEERSIHALVLYPGASVKELDALLTLLHMKPAALRALGGAKKQLEEQAVVHIRILATRLEEVSEAGEVAAALLESVAGLAGTTGGAPALKGPGAGGRSAPGKGPGDHGPGESSEGKAPGLAPALLRALAGTGGGSGQDLATTVGQVQGFLASLVGSGSTAADVSGFGAFLEGMGLDRQGNQPATQGVISKAVTSLDPLQQLSILLGAEALRPGPLRNVFGRLSANLAAPGLASAYSAGAMTPRQIVEAADRIKGIAPPSQNWVGQITEALRRAGMSEGQLKDLMDILTWDSLPVEERIRTLLEGQRIFEMPADKVLAFLRELLEAGRNTEFIRLVRHFATGLLVPAVTRRMAVAEAFEKIADWVDIPGMPGPIMEELMGTLSRAYGREKDPEVHQWFSLAVEHILWFLMESGIPQRACALFTELQDVVTELSPPAAWKEQATAELLHRLGSPERLDKVLSLMFVLDRQAGAEQIHPFLALLGPSAANHLVERLSQETDRGRRGRLLEALKACGHIAEAPLLEALKSSEWFVVRNTLIVLSEVAGPERVPELEPFLAHTDARVRLAAVRTLGRIGGRSAEAALTRLLQRPETGLQLEALFMLDELKAKNAIPAILDFLKAGRGRNRPGQDKVREKALELLGHLGSTAVVPDLARLLARQRGFFRNTCEPLPIRVGALRALHALGNAEAQDAIAKALASEPAGPEREALQNALQEALSGGQPATP